MVLSHVFNIWDGGALSHRLKTTCSFKPNIYPSFLQYRATSSTIGTSNLSLVHFATICRSVGLELKLGVISTEFGKVWLSSYLLKGSDSFDSRIFPKSNIGIIANTKTKAESKVTKGKVNFLLVCNFGTLLVEGSCVTGHERLEFNTFL